MNIVAFKEALLKGVISDNLIIFVCPENYFLAEQYIDKICELHGLEKNVVSSIYAKQTATELLFSLPTLNIVKTDTFSETAADYSQFINTVVLCKSVDKKIIDVLTDYIIEIPKLLSWHIEAYIQAICPDLTEKDAQWLCSAASGNIYLVSQELDKLKMFNSEEIGQLFAYLQTSPDSNLCAITNFTLADAIVKNNKEILKQFFKRAKSVDIDPMSIIGILIGKFKNINLINFGQANAEAVGISEKMARGIQYYEGPRVVSAERAKKSLTFLTSLDAKLKSGKLDMSKADLLTYIICNLV